MILDPTPPIPPTWIDMLRHGEPVGGSIYRGHRDDPLTERGWQQMSEAIGAEEEWDAILTSPLERCRAFAEVLAAERDLPLYQDADFREVHFGQWEGCTVEQVMARDGKRLTEFWAGDEDYPPPGGETLADFQRRVAGAWAYWTDRLQGQRILLVCHSGVIRMVMAEVLGISAARSVANVQVPYASRSRIRLDHTDHGVFSCLIAHGFRPGQLQLDAA
ncbi:histidine phosphatase family protein [Isoalcanivorax pacificus]|jgi:alpha-ribazole phosphatase|nr:histidine phosphatase family protein [Isoalcanivorax pacificus]